MTKRWIPHAKWARQPKPHAEMPPEGLWWFDRLTPSDSTRVIAEYVRRRSHGAPAVEGLEDELERWCQDLSRKHGRYYWTIPSYAISNRENPKTACKWFRELENVAKSLFPKMVPAHRNVKPLTQERVKEIQSAYLESGDAKALSVKFNVPAFRIGQLCRKQKALRQQD